MLNQENLYKKYPLLFKQVNLPMSQSCMYFGIECPNTWYDIIENACERIQNACDSLVGQIEFCQIKEKFGGLRMYYDFKYGPSELDDIIYEIIRSAETDVELLNN